MSDPVKLLEMMQIELRGDEDAWRTLVAVQEQLLLDVDQYPKTVARNRYNRLAKESRVAVVTEHGRPETASVIMRLGTLTGLLVEVVRAAQQKRDRVPFSIALAQMKPVRGPVRRLELDSHQEHHQLRPIAAR